MVQRIIDVYPYSILVHGSSFIREQCDQMVGLFNILPLQQGKLAQ